MPNINFDQYKPRLREYLSMRGIEVKNNENIRCFSPTHQDNEPSCQVREDKFRCFACGIKGDIFDAVEILEGVTSPIEQFNFVQKLFSGSAEINPFPKKEKEEYKLEFIPEEKTQEFEKYLKSITNDSVLKNFLYERAKYSSHEQINSFSQEIIKNALPMMFWWNGLDSAKKDGISDDLLFSVGAMHNNEKGELKKTFWHSGVILKTGIGYKLHYYDFDKEKQKYICRKIASHKGKGFPCPDKPLPEKIVIVEGELKALICQSAGLTNVFSCGGVESLTKNLIQEFIIKQNVKEITIFFDNDTRGQEAQNKIAEFLKKNSFEGKIFLAKSDELKEHKDQDEAILFGHLEYVKNAINNAIPYLVSNNQKQGKGNLSIRQIKALLKKIPSENLEEKERKTFIECVINAGKDYEKIRNALILWGALKGEIPQVNENVNIQVLNSIAINQGLPRYTISRLKSALENEIDYNKVIFSASPIVDVKINELLESELLDDLLAFVEKDGYKSEVETVNILEFYLANKIIYIEELKEFYYFDGLVWNHRPDVTDIAYNILKEIALQYHQGDAYSARKVLDKISQYKFCQTVMKGLSEKPSIFRKQITFDSSIIKETLTLQDCVLDFSGKEIEFRDSKPNEYRMKKLPYYRADCESNKYPTHFMNFMNENFDNKDTLNSLMYFLSLIPSRHAQFKVGGIFTGKPHTGKTTTMEIIAEIYQDMTTPIPRSLIMNSKYGNDDSGANPGLADLEGMGAGISDETEKNDHLNSAMWKKLTGGGKLKARQLYRANRVFEPTAQTIILTNYSPLFDKADQAVIDRMLIIQFAKQHEKGQEGTKTPDELKEEIRAEFPQIVKMFAERYIKLKNELHGKIPLSTESEEYKKDYIENMDDNGLQSFVQKYVDFAKGSGKWVLLKDIYKRYCLFWNVEVDGTGKPINPDHLTQSKFTRYLKRDYNEFKVKQMRVNGYPEQVVMDVILKEWNEVPEQNLTTSAPMQQNERPMQNQTQITPPPPPIDEENPFGDNPQPVNIRR